MSAQPTLFTRSTWIDLCRIQEGTHPLVLDGRESSLSIEPETDLVRFRVEGTLSFDRTDCRVRGSLTGTLGTVCDRCLARFEREIRSELDQTVAFRESASRPGSKVPAETGPRTLDLAGPLKEAVLLEIPIKNLCREDCRGICPSCGTNRNVESCDCEPVSRDPRWDALKGLSFSQDPEE